MVWVTWARRYLWASMGESRGKWWEGTLDWCILPPKGQGQWESGSNDQFRYKPDKPHSVPYMTNRWLKSPWHHVGKWIEKGRITVQKASPRLPGRCISFANGSNSTRGENTLDLFAANNNILVTRCVTIPGMSDHDCVLVESRLHPKKFRVRKGTFPVWRMANWNDIKTHLSEAWWILPQDQKDDSSTDSLWVWFKTTLEGTIQKHVPHRQVKGKGRHPWISWSLKRLMSTEAKLYSRKKYQPMQHNICRYQRQIQKFYQEYRMCINQIIFNLQTRTLPKTRRPYGITFKKLQKVSIGIGMLRDNTSGELLFKRRQKAELLNYQFQSVFSCNTPLMPKHLCQQATRLLPARTTSEKKRHPIMPEFNISTISSASFSRTSSPTKLLNPTNSVHFYNENSERRSHPLWKLSLRNT